jgi:hypothetical protein
MPATRTLHVQGEEFPTLDEAIQETYASGSGEVIKIGGKFVVVGKAEADRLTALSVPFAFYCDHELPNGEVMTVTVPVGE